MSNFDVAVIGMGPVGSVSAACFAKQGFSVVGVEKDFKRLSSLSKGIVPFMEPGLDELMEKMYAMKRFQATADTAFAVRSSRIVMIAVGTPTPEDGSPDLSYIASAAREIGEALKGAEKGPIVVVRSTVPPGTMRNLIAPIIEEASGLTVGKDFHIASNPEFLREGKAIKDFFFTGRIVIGTDSPEVAEQIEELYQDVSGKRMHVGVETAEFAKYVDNTWHALKVAYANEIGRVCMGFGGNPEQTIDVFLNDDQLNISKYYLRPGFAFGGSCLPKDVRGLGALARKHSVNIPLVNAILPSNNEQILQGFIEILATGAQKVGLLGVAFKEKVDDLRESPALYVASRLFNAGVNIHAHDFAFSAGDEIDLPKSSSKLVISNLQDVVNNSETLVIMHNLPEYHEAAEVFRKAGGRVIDLTTVTVRDHADTDQTVLAFPAKVSEAV
jgi:GDP-mannose 6-dehydrogenase